ncbi:elongator complex protein 1-like isoform X2 [Patiria miniata]|uniref:Elongator complex protein 1 n=1 Tax=Patiria miniata TaxID=46514 RepID=A0A914BPU1_PATMI|nr:elongator complex protein 1-like isoform X2 [Patiria miniata]
MRNLELLLSSHIDGLSELEGCHELSVDYDTGRVYLTTRDSKVICLDPQAQEILWTLSLVEQGYATPSEGSVIIAIQHLPDQQSVCVATGRGDVLLYNTLSCELECVGSVESGLTSMTWSPDQQLLVLSTGASTLILMTKDFDPIIETAMHPQEFGEQQPITVGWGKKETQFHGTAGKQAAVRTMEDVKPALAWDDMKVRVSWRGDGQFFTVSAISPDTGVRKLRIWSRDCILQYTSEDLNGLEQALSWKPSGSLIVVSQRLEDRHDVIFFEKNGLRHGEFTLPFDKMAVKVCEILWNTESSVMAVWLEDLHSEAGQAPCSYVQLWTVGNYHWYLKQSLDFPASDRLTAMQWDPEHGYRLHIITQSARYLQYTWSWATNHSKGTDCSDDAYVAVIDGDKVLMTPFRKMVVPPPISAYTMHLPKPVNQVCFAPPPHSNKMAALMSDGKIAIYVKSAGENHSSDIDSTVRLVAAGGNGFKAMVTPHSLKAVLCIEDESGSPLVHSYPSQYHHLQWVSSQTFILISSDPGGVGSTLHRVSLSEEDVEMPKLCVKSQSTIFGQVYRVSCNPSTETIAVQLVDGSVVTTDNEPIVKLPQPCTQMALCTMGGQEVVLGLTERYRFYINETEFASNCTSFAVHDEYLLMTTHSHTCRCISLNSNPKAESKSLDESIRRVERGSRIVVVVPGDTKLILQMPRGNLETIHPRALVLSAIKKLLNGLKYQEAFLVMKRHRINWNLFYDHDPKAFFNNIDHFVRELDSATSLNLFLADLKEEDTTQTLYSAAYSRSPEKTKTAGGSKVDAVCDAVRESLDRIDPNKFFLSVLTAHVKKNQPELEIALQRIQQLTQLTRPGTGNDPGPGSGCDCPTPDEALRYLIILVDVNQLFDVALGTYDFKLVLMVAEKSQKDPKEYLPFLNQLRSLETNYQRYTIDKHLRRYSKALRHISRCPGDERFVECMSLVAEHKLYSEALQLFDRGSERYEAIGIAYGDYLQSKNRYADAALVFTLCSQWERALEMHSRCGQWQQAFCMASRLNYTADQLAETARKLAVYLSGHRRHSEAASILVEYADDVEEAISVLITGCHWAESLRLMYKHKREDIIETHLKPALVERCSSTQASLENFLVTFDKHKKRLAVVRENKLCQEQEEGADFNDVDADLYSDTSSVGGSAMGSVTSFGSSSSAYSTSTTSSKTSGRSRKNRRKAEQKKRSLKEGSKHEDLALLDALIEIMKNVDQLKGDVGHLLPILVMFDFKEEAQQLQQSLQDALKSLEAGRAEIWIGNITQPTMGTAAGFGPQYTSNAIAASMTAPGPLGAPPSTPSPDDVALFVPPKLSKDDKWRLHMLEPR